MRKPLLALIFAITLFSFSKNVSAHCEIPCGIYEDSLRVELMFEHILTIEKSMNEIKKLEAEKPVNYNQLVRWINNKEEHANKLQDIATQYFMFQRIKPDAEGNYDARNEQLLQYAHLICVYAMKAKQTTEQQWIVKLRGTVKKFAELYFNTREHSHEHPPKH